MTDDSAGGKPGFGKIDGTAAFDDDGATGYLFLFNPGPTQTTARIPLDQGVGIQPLPDTTGNASALGLKRQWAVYEIFPHEELNGTGSAVTPFAIVTEGGSLTVSPRGNQALGYRFASLPPSTPVCAVLGLTYAHAACDGKTLVVTGASGLAGSSPTLRAVVEAAAGAPISVSVNGKAVAGPHTTVACIGFAASATTSCLGFTLAFAGEPLTEMMPVSNQPPGAAWSGGWYNTTFKLNPAMWVQRQARQAAFNVTWAARDMDAPWLGNRILMYPFILQPKPGTTPPRAAAAVAPPAAWQTLPGYACDIGKAPLFGQKAPGGDVQCQQLCEKASGCVEWQLAKSSNMCWGYDVHSRPAANPNFDCGCKGSCGAPPPPPPPAPAPAWQTLKGYACNIAKTALFGIKAPAGDPDTQCQQLCEKKVGCIEWLLIKSSSMCYGYDVHNEPGQNPDFDCGCKGTCTGGPSPGPAPPSPGQYLRAAVGQRTARQHSLSCLQYVGKREVRFRAVQACRHALSILRC